MRSVVVDYARQRLAQKRGGDLHRVTDLPEDIEGGLRLDEDMLGLDTALPKLAAVDERLARVVELSYLAGLPEMELTAPLDRSDRSIRHDWTTPKPFLTAAPPGAETRPRNDTAHTPRHPPHPTAPTRPHHHTPPHHP